MVGSDVMSAWLSRRTSYLYLVGCLVEVKDPTNIKCYMLTISITKQSIKSHSRHPSLAKRPSHALLVFRWWAGQNAPAIKGSLDDSSLIKFFCYKNVRVVFCPVHSVIFRGSNPTARKVYQFWLFLMLSYLPRALPYWFLKPINKRKKKK